MKKPQAISVTHANKIEKNDRFSFSIFLILQVKREAYLFKWVNKETTKKKKL
jgi:hypothetical protein